MAEIISSGSPGSVAPSGRTSYVDWPAIFAGAVTATAISWVLLTAGAAIGLSFISPYGGESYTRTGGSIAAFWLVFVPILSLLAGGYIAGRMRMRVDGAGSDEVEFRDGVHGLAVWAVGVILSGILGYFAASTAASIGSSAGSAAASVASSDRGSATIQPFIDSMMRAQAGQQGGNQGAQQPRNREPLPAETRAEIGRIFTSTFASGQLSPDDRRYLAQVVSDRTGLPQPEAEKRVDQARQQAQAALDKARKAAVAAALATATAMMLGLAAAWFAAQRGGHHRDQNRPARLSAYMHPPASRPTV